MTKLEECARNTSDHTDLWNDMPIADRNRLFPFLCQAHILHLEQTRAQIVSSHRALLAQIDGQIKNIRRAMLQSVLDEEK